MKRAVISIVLVAGITVGVLLAARPLTRRFGEIRSDLATARSDTGEVMASATYQRFKARREALVTMRAGLRALAAAESTFFADSGRPTTSFIDRYAFANDRSNLGPTIEVQRDRWIARTGNLHTTMQCTLTAMLDTVTGQYHPGEPVCAGWTAAESLAAVAMEDSRPSPQPRVIDRVSNPGPVNNAAPSLPMILPGVCPGGHCQFGRWTACSTIAVGRDKRHGSPTTFFLGAGEEFTALTAEAHVEKAGLVVFHSSFTVLLEKNDAAGPVVTIIEFSPADTLYPLLQIADHVMVFWFRGAADTGADFWRPDPAVYRPDALKSSMLIRRPTANWWVRIRNSRGQEGWALYDFDKFATNSSNEGAEPCRPAID